MQRSIVLLSLLFAASLLVVAIVILAIRCSYEKMCVRTRKPFKAWRWIGFIFSMLLFAASLLSGCAAMQPIQPPQQVIDCSHSFGSPGCVAVGK